MIILIFYIKRKQEKKSSGTRYPQERMTAMKKRTNSGNTTTNVTVQLQITFSEKKESNEKPKEKEETWSAIKVKELLVNSHQQRVKAFFKLFYLSNGIKDRKGFSKVDYKTAVVMFRDYRQFGEFLPHQTAWMETHIPKYAKQLYEVKRGLR